MGEFMTAQRAQTDIVQEGIQSVENVLSEVIRSDVETLRDTSRHILQAGGKRIRPQLLLLSYIATGGTDVDYAAPVAAAVELVHTASIVHDDINDHGLLRRGRPSVNALWGRTFALLTGDYLFTKVYQLMAPYKDLNIILAEATVALVEGETLQASAVKEGNFSREVYTKIIALKTAALFKAAAKLGAMLANATEEQIEALGSYGYNVGLAFQIVDDILDILADEKQLGKTTGIDTVQGKGLAAIQFDKDNGNGTAVAEMQISDPMAALKSKMLQKSTIEKGQRQAKQLVALAANYLDTLPESTAKEKLIALSHVIVERDH